MDYIHYSFLYNLLSYQNDYLQMQTLYSLLIMMIYDSYYKIILSSIEIESISNIEPLMNATHNYIL